MNKFILILGLILSASSVLGKPQIITLKVPTMTCPVCPITVTKSLEAVDGVSQVEVNYEEQLAQVIYNDETTDVEALIKATTNAGYPSRVNK
ncbi:MAG: mercuric ion binding protein [Oceanospirillaceae bacterium]|jgi:mercuric ion binding protein